MRAVDASILAFAANRGTPEHARAALVVETLMAGDAPWALPWPAVHEFLALVTHRLAVARPLRPEDAWGFVEVLAASPSLRFVGATERHGDVTREVIASLAARGAGLPAGLEVAVVLREHGVRELISADAGMRRFAFLDVRDPLHGPAWRPDERPTRRYRTLTPRTR